MKYAREFSLTRREITGKTGKIGVKSVHWIIALEQHEFSDFGDHAMVL